MRIRQASFAAGGNVFSLQVCASIEDAKRDRKIWPTVKELLRHPGGNEGVEAVLQEGHESESGREMVTAFSFSEEAAIVTDYSGERLSITAEFTYIPNPLGRADSFALCCQTRPLFALLDDLFGDHSEIAGLVEAWISRRLPACLLSFQFDSERGDA